MLILDALRKKKHISHFTLQQALDLIEEVRPKKALLIHISHLMGKHEDVLKELPRYVSPAFDGEEIFI